ncbi:MAG: LiaI-LiaF-like domain-containing protein [Thermoplasmatota archaeon]
MDKGPSPWEAMWANWWALAFVVMGILWLLGDAGYINFQWSYVAPIFLIFLGLAMLFGGWRAYSWRHNMRARWRASRWHDPECTCGCECCARARGWQPGGMGQPPSPPPAQP